MTTLNISPTLQLPIDAVTETFAFLAVRRAGKSNAAVVMAEEMFKAGLPWVAIDPKGDWWGMRSPGRGGEGLPVALFGAAGRRRKNKPDPDIPLEDTAGKVIADLVVEERIPCILDMSGFSEAGKIRFLIDFGTRLFERNDEPIHLFLEECDDYMPQKPFKEQTRLLHIYTKILKQGGSFGIGASLISQRSAVVNKNALSQCLTLVAMRTTAPQDRAAIEYWVKQKEGQHLDIVDSLPDLNPGEAWIWSPTFLHTTEKFRFRKRETFDSGATPKVGQKRTQPKTVADIDLGALEVRMAETIERAKADDPRELRKEISKLRKELQQRPTETQVKEVPVEVPVPLLEPQEAERVVSVLSDIQNASEKLSRLADDFNSRLAKVADTPPPIRLDIQLDSEQVRRQTARRSQPTPPAVVYDGDVKLGKGEYKVLEVLKQYPNGRTQNELAFLAGYSAKASTIGVILSTLRKAGLVTTGQPIRLTDAGEAHVGGFAEPMTGEELLNHWMHHQRMGEGERKVMRTLIDHYPDDISHADLCEETGYSPDASTMGVILSKLRKLGLVEKGSRRMVREFMESIGR